MYVCVCVCLTEWGAGGYKSIVYVCRFVCVGLGVRVCAGFDGGSRVFLVVKFYGRVGVGVCAVDGWVLSPKIAENCRKSSLTA